MEPGQVFRYASLSELNSLEVHLPKNPQHDHQPKFWVVCVSKIYDYNSLTSR